MPWEWIEVPQSAKSAAATEQDEQAQTTEQGGAGLGDDHGVEAARCEITTLAVAEAAAVEGRGWRMSDCS